MQLERSCLRLQLSFLRNGYELFSSSACILEIQLLVEAMSSPGSEHYNTSLFDCHSCEFAFADLIDFCACFKFKISVGDFFTIDFSSTRLNHLIGI